ncbi:MAG: ferritin-like domain-containing protein [Bacillota bacterium]
MDSQKSGMSYKYYPTYMYYPENAYPGALRLIVESVQSEREDEVFYDSMINLAPTEDQKQIIMAIRDDERKHNLMLREIYYQMTGEVIPPTQNGSLYTPANYVEGIVKALFGELAAVERYRRILFGFSFLPFRNMITEIYTDELKHASKWNYLYTLNRTGSVVKKPAAGADITL